MRLRCGFAWFDIGTHDSLLEVSSCVQTLEERQGLRVACLEEIAYNQGFITHEQFATLGQWLLRVPSEGLLGPSSALA